MRAFRRPGQLDASEYKACSNLKAQQIAQRPVHGLQGYVCGTGIRYGSALHDHITWFVTSRDSRAKLAMSLARLLCIPSDMSALSMHLL